MQIFLLFHIEHLLFVDCFEKTKIKKKRLGGAHFLKKNFPYRFAYNADQVKKKPGREVVTFLLVCNLAMWAINSLETNRADSHPIQVFEAFKF